MAKLEKLEQASNHPDLGPVGDGLISLMDQKLSKLDDRLYELSTKYQIQKYKHLKLNKRKKKSKNKFQNQLRIHLILKNQKMQK